MAKYLKHSDVTQVIKSYGKNTVEKGRKKLDPVCDIVELLREIEKLPAVSDLPKADTERLSAEFCDTFCRYPFVCVGQDALDAVCESCPMNKLFELSEAEA